MPVRVVSAYGGLRRPLHPLLPRPWGRLIPRRHAHRSWRVSVGATGYEVVFESASDVDQAAVDAAYHATYGRSSYVDAMVTAAATATTLRLAPALDDRRIDDRHR
jgi:hypothetical protein